MYNDDFDGSNDDFDDDEALFMQGCWEFATILVDALGVLPHICLKYLPDGRFFRGEYMSNHPDHEGDPDSLCINLQTGRWSDIAANVQGFEPVSYYAHITGLPLDEASEMVSREVDNILGREAPVLM